MSDCKHHWEYIRLTNELVCFDCGTIRKWNDDTASWESVA